MPEKVSKSQFKARALELFRSVERSGQSLIITDHGRPVLELVPYCPDPAEVLRPLRNTVLSYEDPLEPVGLGDWEALE